MKTKRADWLPGSKRAQIKIFESIGVLVIFAFLLVFGVNLYFTLAKTGIQRDYERALALHVFTMAQKAAFMPELECQITGISQAACIDLDKANAFSTLIAQDKTNYIAVFGWSTLTLKRIFPPSQPIVLYENKLPGATRIRPERLPMQFYNPVTGTYEFGELEVVNYAK